VVHFTELRSEGADNARIRPLVGPIPSMPSERGLNKPAASDLDAAPLLTPAQAAALLCVSPRTIKRELAKRPARALRFGHQWRIDSAALLAAERRAARKI
jgi:excisionase family DNA binding protein